VRPTVKIPKATVFIEVLRRDKEIPGIGSLKKGTFIQPFPLTRVAAGTDVRWKIKRGRRGDKFRVDFQDDRSPFPGITRFDNETGARVASIRGRNFVYHVFVKDGKTGEEYQIDHSPILCTDP
jgi:hypothetical protein